MKNKIQIIIGGDLAPIRRYEPLFSNNKIGFIDDFIIKEIKESDLFITNLEAPLSREKHNNTSALPKLVTIPFVINGMKKLGIDICCLGNNHIMDAGEEGISTTIQSLKSNGIEYFGAGFNIEDSNKLLIKEIGDKKIGFYSISNNEFSVASINEAGANPEDLIAWYYDIPDYKNQVDYLIIFYHTGIDRSIYPSPTLQKKCKLLIDLGADFITCQHSHVTGTYEEYKGKNIFYGQGDFIFDYGKDIDDYRKFGSLLKIEIVKDSLKSSKIYYKRNGIKLIALKGIEKLDFENEIYINSKNNSDLSFINEHYKTEIDKRNDLYINLILSFGNMSILKILNKIKLTNKILNKNYSKILLNIIQNDIHKNFLINILRKKI